MAINLNDRTNKSIAELATKIMENEPAKVRDFSDIKPIQSDMVQRVMNTGLKNQFIKEETKSVWDSSLDIKAHGDKEPTHTVHLLQSPKGTAGWRGSPRTLKVHVAAKDDAEAIQHATTAASEHHDNSHDSERWEKPFVPSNPAMMSHPVKRLKEESAHSIVNSLKADGKHQEAGAKAFEHGLGRKYGQHFGLRSTRDADEMAFHRGYDKAEAKSKSLEEERKRGNARHSDEAAQNRLTPRAPDVKRAQGTTNRDKATTNKYALKIAKINPEYKPKDVVAHLKSLEETAEQIDEKMKFSGHRRVKAKVFTEKDGKPHTGEYTAIVKNVSLANTPAIHADIRKKAERIIRNHIATNNPGHKITKIDHTGMEHIKEGYNQARTQGTAYGRRDISGNAGFKTAELNAELGHEENIPHAVHIDGKHWKTFPSVSHATNVANSLIRKGKKAAVYVAEAAPQNFDEYSKQETEKDTARKVLKYGGTGGVRKFLHGVTSALVGTKHATRIAGKFGNRAQQDAAVQTVNKYKMKIKESDMSAEEKAKREEIVMGMKPVSNWEKRYPGRGEKVMYATATKMAMKEEQLGEEEMNRILGEAAVDLNKIAANWHKMSRRAQEALKARHGEALTTALGSKAVTTTAGQTKHAPKKPETSTTVAALANKFSGGEKKGPEPKSKSLADIRAENMRRTKEAQEKGIAHGNAQSRPGGNAGENPDARDKESDLMKSSHEIAGEKATAKGGTTGAIVGGSLKPDKTANKEKPEKEDEKLDEALKGKQNLLDVAAPKGKLTAADFKRLRAMRKGK